ncbi:hypothetical protein HGRIS_003967 [Hohenbuehelia grisea]|uniref:Ubiquinone biosynthesis protein n=1 Tax=Hohenbuehelia grisea TaxID=104357 RepID=A0ABR3JH25_9AGAR
MMSTSTQLLRLALPLVKIHGFTRVALAESVLSLPTSNSSAKHSSPLSETAVSALFGHGDDARRTLIEAWLAEGLSHMRSAAASGTGTGATSQPQPSLRTLLQERLNYNEPVIHHIPEAFALLLSPSSGVPLLDPTRALKHAASVADEACHLCGDASLQLSWYTRRASVAVAYSLAELHQLTSPATAPAFLDTLLDQSSQIGEAVEETSLYANYVVKSWGGLLRSLGAF